MLFGAKAGASSTGRPESNSTACKASEEDTSCPASGCGMTARSASRDCCARISSSRPATETKFAVAPPPARASPTATPCSATAWSNSTRTSCARVALSFSVATIMSSIIAPDRPSPANGATSRASTRTCSTVRCAFQIRAASSAASSAALPAEVSFNSRISLRIAMLVRPSRSICLYCSIVTLRERGGPSTRARPPRRG